MKKKEPIKIIGERDIALNISTASHHDAIVKIGKALSSPIRIHILSLLRDTILSIQEIAKVLSIPVSSTAAHIKCLEDAHLVITETQPGAHGSMRVCICSVQTITLDTALSSPDILCNTASIEMPIGCYYQCQVEPTCGLADENGTIDSYDSPKSFYSANRMNAQLLWFQQGYVEYRFQNILNPLLRLQEIEFSMELCSEAPGYLENWPSDITISINGIEATTFCSPGDYGARRGFLTPISWPNGRTQYGLLKYFSVRDDGVYIDKKQVNTNVTLANLKLLDHPYISLTIEIKKDARHVGGINLFGKKYGDYPQGIIMTLVYSLNSVS